MKEGPSTNATRIPECKPTGNHSRIRAVFVDGSARPAARHGCPVGEIGKHEGGPSTNATRIPEYEPAGGHSRIRVLFVDGSVRPAAPHGCPVGGEWSMKESHPRMPHEYPNASLPEAIRVFVSYSWMASAHPGGTALPPGGRWQS